MASAYPTDKLNKTLAADNSEILTKPIHEWSTAEVDKVYRAVSKSAEAADLRVAWLGNHTIEPVVRTVTAFSSAYGVALDAYIAPYDQHFQEMLDGNSGTLASKPNLIVLWLSLRSMSPTLAEGCVRLGKAEIQAEIERIEEVLSSWVDLAKQRSGAHVFICNFPRPPGLRFGIADTSSDTGEQYFYGELNRWMSDAFMDDPQVTVVDISHAVSRAGSEKSWNPRMYHLAKIEWDGPAVRYIADLLSRCCRALVRPAHKCIVVDLDNTLWGGVLGEEGVDGVRVGQGDPASEAFAAFQRSLLDMKARGIILAICSKNNFSDVEELFTSRPDMPLRLEDFATHRINWEPKNLNVEAIAKELNIGTDSLVFIDDNPAECELIRQMLPDVKTVHLPRDPATYAELLYSMCEFDKIKLTDEDKQKTQQYIDNHARQSQRQAATDLKSYLESLGTRVTIQAAVAENLPRIHQLFTKTNQFNVTTIRYSAAELKEMIDAEDCTLDFVKVEDNFGSLGIVGVYIVRAERDHAVVDSFVLSCRALGRGIESAICNQMKEQVFANEEIGFLTARFVPTAKNMPASEFFDAQGFERLTTAQGEEKIYRLNRMDAMAIECPGVSVTVEEAKE